MARVVTSVALILSLFFLFTFSHARYAPIHESESVSANEIHPEPETETTSSSISKPQDDTVFNLNSVDPAPLTFVSFRPINRHIRPNHQFPLPLSFRLGHRRCRHGHHREIPYGNDMILRSSDRQIPERWVRLRHAQPRISEMMVDHHHHRHGEMEEHKERGFMNKIRKFMDLL